MKCNVGGVDRDARLIGGTFLATLGIFGAVHGGLRGAALALGTMELITGLTRYCPLNNALGLNTCVRRPTEAIEDATQLATQEANILAE